MCGAGSTCLKNEEKYKGRRDNPTALFVAPIAIEMCNNPPRRQKPHGRVEPTLRPLAVKHASQQHPLHTPLLHLLDEALLPALAQDAIGQLDDDVGRLDTGILAIT